MKIEGIVPRIFELRIRRDTWSISRPVRLIPENGRPRKGAVQ